MRKLSEIDQDYASSFADMEEWIAANYNKHFAPYFANQIQLSQSLKSNEVSNEELEQLLVCIPLDLFQVSEVLNEFKLRIESIKLEIRNKQIEHMQKSISKTEEQKRQEARASTYEDTLLLSAYESLVSRVEREMSYSRELIMSAKKIWDGRKEGFTGSMPVAEDNYEPHNLPKYTPNTKKNINNSTTNKTYIQ